MTRRRRCWADHSSVRRAVDGRRNHSGGGDEESIEVADFADGGFQEREEIYLEELATANSDEKQ